MITLNPGEHIEYIDDKLQLIVSKEHTFGTDAILLASFAAPKRNETVCDFGTGCGIIPFYWLSKGLQNVNAVEIQTNACEMLERSVILNGIEERVKIYNNDIKDLNGILPNGGFSLITMNPPYTAIGKGIISDGSEAVIARHETMLTPGEMFSSAARLLKYGGRMCVCFKPERLAEIIVEMHSSGIEPKRLRFVCQTNGREPWLFLLEGKKGRAPGIIVEKNLCIKNEDGTDSEEMLQILEGYRKAVSK